MNWFPYFSGTIIVLLFGYLAALITGNEMRLRALLTGQYHRLVWIRYSDGEAYLAIARKNPWDELVANRGFSSYVLKSDGYTSGNQKWKWVDQRPLHVRFLQLIGLMPR